MADKLAQGYRGTYELFVSPLMKSVRREAYDEDIGQHSWITAAELRSYLPWLALSENDTFLDFGCGPGGPLTFLSRETGARGIGIDLSAAAIEVALQRAEELGVSERVEVLEVDGNSSLHFETSSFDCIVSLDVVLHLQDRRPVFAEWCRLLKPGGKLLFTDAGIVTGPISNQEVHERSINGFTQFVPPEFNDDMLPNVGFELLERQDQTAGPIANASGRIACGQKYRAELIEALGETQFEKEQQYLRTVVSLYETGALSRFAYQAVCRK